MGSGRAGATAWACRGGRASASRSTSKGYGLKCPGWWECTGYYISGSIGQNVCSPRPLRPGERSAPTLRPRKHNTMRRCSFEPQRGRMPHV
eukprot:scaffold48126_cov34-Phaeocystis_antarctica.AAC.2